MSDEIQDKVVKLQLRLAQLNRIEHCQNDFLGFVEICLAGSSLQESITASLAEKFERVAKGELKRLIINMAPRHTKSEFASYLLPAWFIGQNPAMKIIQATHTTELAVSFGRKVKNLLEPRGLL